MEKSKNFLFFFVVFFLFACSKDDLICISNEYNSTASLTKAQKNAITSMAFFRDNECNFMFMKIHNLKYTDLKYGLSRAYERNGAMILEIPVIRGLLFGRRMDWMKGNIKRANVLVLFDRKGNIQAINFTEQTPFKEYYNNHAVDIFYDNFIGNEDVYDKEDNHIAYINVRKNLTRTTINKSDSDSISEYIEPEAEVWGIHPIGGGDDVFPTMPDTTAYEDDFTVVSDELICSKCGSPLTYSSSSNTWYCPVCDEGMCEGGGGGGSARGGNVDGSNSVLSTNWSGTKGYVDGYTKYKKFEFDVFAQKAFKIYNSSLAFDQKILFLNNTPRKTIGQSARGCVPACINHLLMYFGRTVTSENNIWNTYYKKIYKRNHPEDLFLNINDIKARGVYESDINDLLSHFFIIRKLNNAELATSAIKNGHPVLLVYIIENSGWITQDHVEIIYGYYNNVWGVFDPSYQEFLVCDPSRLEGISYLYEIVSIK